MRAADLLREHRGNSHVIAWAVAGADAVEVLLLTERYSDVPARAYAPLRGWTEADLDAAFERLQRADVGAAAPNVTGPGGLSPPFRGKVWMILFCQAMISGR